MQNLYILDQILDVLIEFQGKAVEKIEAQLKYFKFFGRDFADIIELQHIAIEFQHEQYILVNLQIGYEQLPIDIDLRRLAYVIIFGLIKDIIAVEVIGELQDIIADLIIFLLALITACHPVL